MMRSDMVPRAGGAHAEAHTAHRLDQRRVTQLPTEGGDVHVERLARPEPVAVPHLLEDPLARVDGPRIAEQVDEKLELLGRQVDELVADPGLVRAHVHGDPVAGQHLRRRR